MRKRITTKKSKKKPPKTYFPANQMHDDINDEKAKYRKCNQ